MARFSLSIDIAERTGLRNISFDDLGFPDLRIAEIARSTLVASRGRGCEAGSPGIDRSDHIRSAVASFAHDLGGTEIV